MIGRLDTKLTLKQATESEESGSMHKKWTWATEKTLWGRQVFGSGKETQAGDLLNRSVADVMWVVRWDSDITIGKYLEANGSIYNIVSVEPYKNQRRRYMQVRTVLTQ